MLIKTLTLPTAVRVCFVQASLLLFQAIYASVAAQTDTAQLLQEVIITSQRTAQTAINIPYSTQAITTNHLQNYQPRTTPEALTGVAGVFVQKTNHGGGSPFLRGLTGNQTLLLVDGIRLNNATFRYGPNQYLNTIDAFTINKIEVAKGTGSVQYGSDAIGGVLQVFTKEPRFLTQKPAWSGRVFSRLMTGDMEKTVRGEVTYASEKTATLIGATYRNFGDLIGGDTTGKQSPSGYKEYAFDAKSKLLLKQGVELTLAHQFLQQQHVPVYHKVVLENFAINEFDPQQRMLNYAKLNISNSNPLINNIQVITSWQQTVEGRTSRKNSTNLLRHEKDEVNTIGLTTDVASRFTKAWTANSGIELYRDKINSSRTDLNTQTNSYTSFRGLYPNRSTYGNYSLYSLHHINLNRWLMEGGLRYNIFAIHIVDTEAGDVSIKPASFVYNASLAYRLNAVQRLYVSFNSGYRAPNVDDMGTLGIVDFRYEVPAYNLAPERTRNIEVGYKLQSGKLSADISGYYMHLHDLITRVSVVGEVINGYPVYKKENVERGYIKGFETALKYQLLKDWAVSGNVAYTYGQSLTRNEPVRRIPPMHGRMNSTYHLNKWFGAAEVLFASKQDRLAKGDKDDNRIPAGGTHGWNVVNLYAGYELRKVKFNLGLQNLLNEDYRTHGSGINGVGRSAWMSIAVQL